MLATRNIPQKLATLLSKKGINNPAVINAIKAVHRQDFTQHNLIFFSDKDIPLPIGFNQSQLKPYVMAKMLEIILGDENHLDSVLEIGTGSGYCSAVLANLSNEVYTMELNKNLLYRAIERFHRSNIKNIKTKYANGQDGWGKFANYDAIIVTEKNFPIGQCILNQLSPNNGRLITLGNQYENQQELMLFENRDGTITVSHYYCALESNKQTIAPCGASLPV